MASTTKSFDVDTPMKYPADLVWHTFIVNIETTLPAAMPGHFTSMQHVDGTPLTKGSVLLAKYGDGFGHYSYIKGVWEEVDHKNFCAKIKIVDGGFLDKHFKAQTNIARVLPGPDEGSCVLRISAEYQDIGEHNNHDVIKEEFVKIAKSIESHLSSNEA